MCVTCADCFLFTPLSLHIYIFLSDTCCSWHLSFFWHLALIKSTLTQQFRCAKQPDCKTQEHHRPDVTSTFDAVPLRQRTKSKSSSQMDPGARKERVQFLKRFQKISKGTLNFDQKMQSAKTGAKPCQTAALRQKFKCKEQAPDCQTQWYAPTRKHTSNAFQCLLLNQRILKLRSGWKQTQPFRQRFASTELLKPYPRRAVYWQTNDVLHPLLKKVCATSFKKNKCMLQKWDGVLFRELWGGGLLRKWLVICGEVWDCCMRWMMW